MKTLRTDAAPGPFAWVNLAFKSRRTMKTWIRCCAAFAATAILLVSRKTSDTMGQAAFFSLLVAVILPPSLALSVFLVAAITLLIGMLLGWAWGNAAMASALAARSSTLLMQQKEKLAQSVSLQTQLFTFHGNFLDPRSSAVYGAFLFVGAFGLGAMRAYLPNLTILAIFGNIVLDVVCPFSSASVVIPTKDYTLAKLFILPTTFYIPVAIGSLVLIFPESLSHVWVTSLAENFWAPVLDILRLQSDALSLTPSDTEMWAQMNAKGTLLREQLIRAANEVNTQLKFINIDTSIGRLGPSDLRKINAELKSIMFRASGLHSFSTFVNDINVMEIKELNPTVEQPGSGTQKPSRYQALLFQTKERELLHGHDLDSLLPILQLASENIRASLESTLICVISWFQDSNSRRLTGLFKRKDVVQIQERQQMLAKQLKELVAALSEFRLVERKKLIKPYEKFFDPETKILVKSADMFASRSLYVCFVFIDTIDAFAERMVDMLKIIITIDAQRPTVKIWFPGRISSLKDSITGDDFEGLESPFSMGSSQDPSSFDPASGSGIDSESSSILEEEDNDVSKTTHAEKEDDETGRLADAPSMLKRNPDAFSPKTGVGRAMFKLAPIFRFFKSPEGILALRSGIVSVALWIPAVCPQSAWFYYENKGIWALIMAQLGLATYAGDQIAGFILRFAATAVGLIIGMTLWYIGAGLGHGNPYGVVIALAMISPFLLARISAPLSQMNFWLVGGVTTVFVVGYSWVNANQFLLAKTGVGVAIGWKRALLVIIGFAASLIVMLFPNPVSSRILVRKTLAAIAGEVGHIFAGEVEAFLVEATFIANANGDKPTAVSLKQKKKRTRKIAARVITVAQRLRFIQSSLTTAQFEPQFAGTWPHALYAELYTLQVRMLAALAVLIVSFSKLDVKWCSALVRRTAYLNPNFLSDTFMMINLLSNSLTGGHALPAQLPRLRDRLVYHEYHSNANDIWRDGNHEHTRHAAGPSHVDGSSIGLELDQLTLDILFDEQLPVYSTTIVAFSSLVTRIDEMADIVRTLCGEATFRGYEALQQDYLDREEKCIGTPAT
ncbi:hypothetical protein HYPSUDRAFT_131287 [Hypholoma sublateritium FD-334 SS-4]|uniref:ER transporter 6TM N-terminal domain-containing protein n=1 Tax=Hypholoma sublateritium (strain FD-334 SS-4) TaxID=945553 RepID=A0A0D2PFU3_HYPSF|nr:hypothetical protein HYPSUDRAFT_131287 [Hypholoma sublateritium FD-334 SS-4]